MSAQALIQKGVQIQEQSLASTTRSKRMIEDSRAVGIEAATKLKMQTEQLRNIDEDVMKVRPARAACPPASAPASVAAGRARFARR
jgi:3-methyladenine DNA glycosylase AlkD